MQALIGTNFTAIFTSFDGNEIDISGAQNGVMWSVGHLSSVLEEQTFVVVSYSIEKQLYNVQGINVQYFTFDFVTYPSLDQNSYLKFGLVNDRSVSTNSKEF